MALLMLLGGHPSSMLIPSMSVFDELVVEYSDILVLGISYSPKSPVCVPAAVPTAPPLTAALRLSNSSNC